MKAVVFSDLHLDHSGEPDFAPDVAEDVDVVIVAGDVTAPVASSCRWAWRSYARHGVPVVMVAGNHEHYRHGYEESIADVPDLPHVHMLENRSVVIAGVRFLGATLWTDFELYGNQELAMSAASIGMNDYRFITSRDAQGRPRRFTPEITLGLHRGSRAWLEQTLALPFEGPTIVVTHTAPHEMSVAEEFRGDPLTPAFCSNLSEMIERFEPEFWIHGHTHSSFDYVVPGTQTRVICNPRGYVRTGFNRSSVENMMFIPGKTFIVPV
ncbi:Metallophosphoesterase [Neorhizobium galegae bv. officinalis]|uniref:metallophosphoesterase n=1 Tax=Neorhizobium sp. T6_25 TaxID=2093833 RepID=UPI0006221645|nr:metallophosphoesterase [Neorhizobium sp. T6_25]CDZ39060.1 Metallophosphoesterase [Neorhizobium galegae bv. officinalis]